MSRFYFLFFLLIFLAISSNSWAARQMEYLDRGIVAVPTSAGIMVSWRITGSEYADNATYNLYRGETKIASDLLVSNYVDKEANGDGYSVVAVVNGVEQERSEAVSSLANQFFTIPVRKINGNYDNYSINDASVGDLDGDGEYEIVVKRLANEATPTSPYHHFLEAYKLDGTFLWAIDLGPNMRNAVEINFLVYDLDGDGKAEVATRTCDLTVDGVGKTIGDRDKDGKTDYTDEFALNVTYFRIGGPDYISIFDGETGAEVAWDYYIERDPLSQWGPAGQNPSQLSHRATKCMWSVAYTDGVNPCFVISRGIYERIKLEAWNFRNGKLSKEWSFDSSPNGVASAYHGEGFHNFVVGDVDGDGKDEIMYGAMALDSDGKGLYATGYEHGDAQHLADINPNIPGLEHFTCHEHAGHVNEHGKTIPGLALRNAKTGEIQWELPVTGDIGRCMAADIDPNYDGYEIWGSAGGAIFSCTGEKIVDALPTTAGGGATYNFAVWWTGDLQREFIDKKVISKWDPVNKWTIRTTYMGEKLDLWRLASITDNNGSKSNPCLQADIIGDWREELIFRKSDNSGMVVFVTPFSTEQRMYTLMHDKNYRNAISSQQNSYNQPPNLSFYFGGGMDTPPVPNINIVKVNEGPKATLTNPLDKASSRVNETVTMKANVIDDYGVAQVAFIANNADVNDMKVVGTDTEAPYSYNWTPTETGTYYLVVKATDTHGVTTNSNIITYTITESEPLRFVYKYDNSGDMSWENINSWTPSRLPTEIDTAVISDGEIQITSYIGCPVIVDKDGIYRAIGNYETKEITLNGGTMKVHTSSTEYGMKGAVNVIAPSTIWAGSTTSSLFLCDLVFSGEASLSKTNVGILQLQKSSPNYSGNWSVREGKISTKAKNAVGTGNITVSNSCEIEVEIAGGLSGCDSLKLESGSILNLNADYDTVKVLKLAEKVVPAGTYTKSDYPDFITGSGKLVVLTGTTSIDPIDPDTVVTDTVETDTVETDTTVIDPVDPDTVVTDTVVTDTVSPDTTTTDSVTTDILIIGSNRGNIVEALPNPMTPNGFIRYDLKNEGSLKLVIYDNLGRTTSVVRLSGKAGKVMWRDLHIYKTGVYTAVIYNKRKEQVRVQFYY